MRPAAQTCAGLFLRVWRCRKFSASTETNPRCAANRRDFSGRSAGFHERGFVMLKYVKRYWLFALLAPLFMIGEVLMDLVQPSLMRTIVDEGVLGLSSGGQGNLRLVVETGLKMIGLVAIGGICGVLSGVFANLCSQNFGNDVRKDCFSRILSLSFEQVDRFSTGSLITRVTNDITQVQNLVTQSIRGFVRTFMLFAGGIVSMTALDLGFGAIVACSLPFVLGCVIFFLRRANPVFGKLQQKLDRVNSVMQENVSGARVVKAYVQEEREGKRFSRANQDLIDTQLHVLLLFSYMMPLMNIAMNAVVVAILYFGAIRVQAGALTPGSVMAAITYTSLILHSVIMLVNIFQTISRGSASAKRLKEILSCVPSIADGDNRDQPVAKGKIEFRDVSFSYPGAAGEPVLKHIDLTVSPGETLGILGSTGSGKSTLVSLLPRFYDVSEGKILIDDVDVREYPLETLRAKIAIALQKSELFNRSIRENILWGRAEASEEEVRRAAKIAQAEEFILSRPEGYDTLVAEKGASLSGGQKQRIAISRAILKNAEILILDDATSALDLATEARFYQALRESGAQSTKILIAQRVASIKNADRIAVLENGRIVGLGSHEELWETCEIYRDICRSQLGNGGMENA